jgi:hypothetical protein
METMKAVVSAKAMTFCTQGRRFTRVSQVPASGSARESLLRHTTNNPTCERAFRRRFE